MSRALILGPAAEDLRRAWASWISWPEWQLMCHLTLAARGRRPRRQRTGEAGRERLARALNVMMNRLAAKVVRPKSKAYAESMLYAIGYETHADLAWHAHVLLASPAGAKRPLDPTDVLGYWVGPDHPRRRGRRRGPRIGDAVVEPFLSGKAEAAAGYVTKNITRAGDSIEVSRAAGLVLPKLVVTHRPAAQ